MQRLSNESAPTWGTFNNDIFSRKQFADRLIGIANDLNIGAVISIDAKWGNGKTWFAKHFHAYANNHGTTAIYLDAFEHDYEEDPLVIFSELIIPVLFPDAIDRERANQKAAKLIQYLAAPISFMAKLGLTAACSTLTSKCVDIAPATSAITNVVNKEFDTRIEQGKEYIAHQLKRREIDATSISSFRDEIRSALDNRDSPLVVIVDELDRCKPTYAVKLLEVLKHFFDCPRLIFVLMINAEQMNSSIKGVYGQNIDAALYLNKFVRLRLRFPTFTDPSLLVQARKEFIQFCLPDFKKRTKWKEDEISLLAHLAVVFDMSLRDLQRVIDHLMISQAKLCNLAIYFTCLKIFKSEIFQRMRTHDYSSHNELREFIHSKRLVITRVNVCEKLYRWHQKVLSVSGHPLNDKIAPPTGDLTSHDTAWLVGRPIDVGDEFNRYVAQLMDSIDSDEIE